MQSVQLLSLLYFAMAEGCISFRFLHSLASSSPDATASYKNATSHTGYDPTLQKCCNGHVLDMPSVPSQCCGTTTYDPKAEICCNGQPNSRTTGAECCGKKAFNSTFQICCSEKIHSVEEDKLGLVKCCVEEYYLPDTQVCCEFKGSGQVHDITITLGLHCCGTELYDKNTQICCSDKTKSHQYIVLVEGNMTSCCAGKTYDWSVNRCCGSTVVGRWQQCCGDGDYNHRTEACCIKDDDPFPNIRKIAISTREEGCCNGLPYNRVTQKCCGNKESYDKKRRICCGEKTFENLSGNFKCCGGQAYDPNEAKCLKSETEKIVVPLSEPEHPAEKQKCHIDGNHTALCCRTTNGFVVSPKLSENSDRCCGKVAFTGSEGICCESKGEYRLHTFVSGNTSCCNLELYDFQTQLCCEKHVVKKLTDVSECCNQVSYDRDTQLCCGGVVVAKKSRNSICCYATKNDK